MKKLLTILTALLFAIGTTANANEIEQYRVQQQGTVQNSISNYTTYTDSKKCIDYIKLPETQSQRARMAMADLVTNDPYIVKINNQKYYMVKTAKNGKYTANNILGYHDKKNYMFNALQKINKDADKEKITRDELKKAQIRFVALQENGKLALNDPSKDFDIEQVEYIDMRYIRNTLNLGDVGVFGYFDMYITNDCGELEHIIGLVTNEKDEDIENLI